MSEIFKHYSEFSGEWPWPDFTPGEVACKHCGELYYDAESLEALQLLRDMWGKPVVITSGHRCKKHNSAVGGKESSQHLKIAFDCACLKKDQGAFVAMAEEAGFTGIGQYPARNFVHLDLGPKRRWRG